MTSFEFVDLPSRGVKGRPDQLIVQFVDSLRDNPGRWALYPRPLSAASASGLAARIKKCDSQVPHPFRDGGFDARTVKGQLYVCYVGAA